MAIGDHKNTVLITRDDGLESLCNGISPNPGRLLPFHPAVFRAVVDALRPFLIAGETFKKMIELVIINAHALVVDIRRINIHEINVSRSLKRVTAQGAIGRPLSNGGVGFGSKRAEMCFKRSIPRRLVAERPPHLGLAHIQIGAVEQVIWALDDARLVERKPCQCPLHRIIEQIDQCCTPGDLTSYFHRP